MFKVLIFNRKINFACMAATCAMVLSACNQGKITCSNAQGLAVLHNRFADAVEKSIKNEGSFDLAEIRDAIADLQVVFEEIRTSKEDPNSTKVFCQATLRITPSEETTDDAETVLKIRTNFDNLEDFLSPYSFQKSAQAANSYSGILFYTLQPSDDKKNVFAEIEKNQSSIIQGPAQLLILAMSKNRALEEKADAEREQQAAEQAAQEAQEEEQRRQIELEAAKKREGEARIAQAKSALQIYKNRLNQIWDSLNPDIAQEIAPMQKAWVRERNNRCKAESLTVTDPTEQIVRLYECQARMTQERIKLFE